MKNLLLKIIALSFGTMLGAQNEFISESSFISMPDETTYMVGELWSFESNKLNITKLDSKMIVNFDYKLDNNKLIINDSLDWGEVRHYDDYFEIVKNEKDIMQYTLLKPTVVNCTEIELQEIITSSNWSYKIPNESGKIHINKTEDVKNLSRYMIIEINDTYILRAGESWNYTIGKISKNIIELYGLNKASSASKNMILKRESI